MPIVRGAPSVGRASLCHVRAGDGRDRVPEIAGAEANGRIRRPRTADAGLDADASAHLPRGVRAHARVAGLCPCQRGVRGHRVRVLYRARARRRHMLRDGRVRMRGWIQSRGLCPPCPPSASPSRKIAIDSSKQIRAAGGTAAACQDSTDARRAQPPDSAVRPLESPPGAPPQTPTMSVAFFKKGKTRPASTRQRSPPPPAPADAPASELVLPSRKAPSRLLSQRTKRARRDSDDDDEPGRVDVNWASGPSSTANTALDILEGDEAEALLARKRAKLAATDDDDDHRPDDGLYKGQAAYRTHVTKSKEVPKAMRVGPQKSTSTIRTVTIVDYQPDVCKDYKGASHAPGHARRACSPTAARDGILWVWRHVQVSPRPRHVCVFRVHTSARAVLTRHRRSRRLAARQGGGGASGCPGV